MTSSLAVEVTLKHLGQAANNFEVGVFFLPFVVETGAELRGLNSSGFYYCNKLQHVKKAWLLGLLVSKLKSDLDAMMDHLNIQTDNPCAVLEQENAKLFLKGTSQDKYKFFLQSTDLAKMRTTYTRIDETTRMIAESTLTQEKAKIVTLRDAKNKVKKHWQEAQKLEWFFVDEKETVAANVENTLKQKERDVVNNAEKLAETKEVVEELEKDQNEANAKLEETSTRMSETIDKRWMHKAIFAKLAARCNGTKLN
ncbi:hypothetical protein JG687_00011999 [Phytophthora cactorum]|uniref:Uncharacterized protein n=1 Tax=Phytophthora cactorum TaxID=29920 RepID=A0A8T1U502_9STRA|nr:hypothetical protein JG687_00011999 [Phytophthora cactorum]